MAKEGKHPPISGLQARLQEQNEVHAAPLPQTLLQTPLCLSSWCGVCVGGREPKIWGAWQKKASIPQCRGSQSKSLSQVLQAGLQSGMGSGLGVHAGPPHANTCPDSARQPAECRQTPPADPSALGGGGPQGGLCLRSVGAGWTRKGGGGPGRFQNAPAPAPARLEDPDGGARREAEPEGCLTDRREVS